MNFLGIDPAIRTCAVCVRTEGGYSTSLYDLSKVPLGSIVGILDELVGDTEIEGLTMERFVAFKGMQTGHSEGILMVIGAILGWAYQRGIPVTLRRSIEWKSKLSLELFKQGFRNKNEGLNKGFSLDAAEFITGIRFKTDHEADAACLAYMADV